MNWLNIFGLTLLALIITFMALRVERGRGWLVVALLIVPAVVVIGRWASVRGHWGDVLVALAITALLTAAWWLAGGRRLPRPSSDSIKVWGQEKAPKLKPGEAAALQAEVNRLREERERLEAEVRRLRSGNGKEDKPKQ
jgi:cell division protein FtsB